MWYIYRVEYYSAIKMNKIGSFVVMRMDLGSVIQSEVGQKNIYHVLTHIYMEFRKMVQMNLFAGQERVTDTEQTCSGGGGEGGMNWDNSIAR